MRIKRAILIMLIGASFLIVGCGAKQNESVDDKKDMVVELDGNIEVDVETKNYIKVTSTYPNEIDLVINKKMKNEEDIKVFEGKLLNNKDGIKIFLESKEDEDYELIAKSDGSESRISFSRKIDKINLAENNINNWNKNSIGYKVDDEVVFEGKNYKCIQNHISQESWNPKEAVTLWQEFKY